MHMVLWAEYVTVGPMKPIQNRFSEVHGSVRFYLTHIWYKNTYHSNSSRLILIWLFLLLSFQRSAVGVACASVWWSCRPSQSQCAMDLPRARTPPAPVQPTMHCSTSKLWLEGSETPCWFPCSETDTLSPCHDRFPRLRMEALQLVVCKITLAFGICLNDTPPPPRWGKLRLLPIPKFPPEVRGSYWFSIVRNEDMVIQTSIPSLDLLHVLLCSKMISKCISWGLHF